MKNLLKEMVPLARQPLSFLYVLFANPFEKEDGWKKKKRKKRRLIRNTIIIFTINKNNWPDAMAGIRVAHIKCDIYKLRALLAYISLASLQFNNFAAPAPSAPFDAHFKLIQIRNIRSVVGCFFSSPSPPPHFRRHF